MGVSTPALHLAFLLCLLLSSSTSHAQITDAGVYDINWADVLTSEPDPLDTSTDIGPCECDITWNRCDSECCCDGDCTEQEIDTFTVCIDEVLTPVVHMCVEADNVAKTNLPGGFYAEWLQDELCVAVDNSVTEGFFFEDPGLDINFDLEFNRNDYSYPAVAPDFHVYDIDLYQSGDNIPGTFNGVESTVAIPGPGPASLCTQFQNVEYLRDVETQECFVQTDDIAVECGRRLNSLLAEQYIQMRATPLSSTFVTVEAGTYFQLDADGIVSQRESTPSTTWDETRCTCLNALRHASWTIIHSVAGEIVSATVDLTVENLSYGENCSSTPVSAYVKQAFDVTFLKVGETPIPKSGNPGYVPGLPVLAGVKTDNSGATAISQSVNGLTTLGLAPTSGQCDERFRSQIEFGVDMSVSCSIMMTIDELRTACVDSVTTFPWALHLEIPEDSFGYWGNSDRYSQWDWGTIQVSGKDFQAAWDETTLSCNDVTNAVDVEVVTADIGSYGNPQSKIVGMRVKYRRGRWRFHSKEFRDGVGQAFTLQSSVTFVNMPDRSLVEVTPPAPPIFPKLPADLFYPFETSPSTRGSPPLHHLIRHVGTVPVGIFYVFALMFSLFLLL